MGRTAGRSHHLTSHEVQPAANDTYIVNGKPALEWVMERQSVSKDKDSGITNDANLWATETMNNPAYPPRTLPPRHHREHKDDEDRGEAAEAGHLNDNLKENTVASHEAR